MGVICPSSTKSRLRLRSLEILGRGRSYVSTGYCSPGGVFAICVGGGQVAINAWPQ